MGTAVIKGKGRYHEKELLFFYFRDRILPSYRHSNIYLSEEFSNPSVDSSIQIRGTREALKAVALHFKAEVTSKPPKFFERVVLPFQVKFSNIYEIDFS